MFKINKSFQHLACMIQNSLVPHFLVQNSEFRIQNSLVPQLLRELKGRLKSRNIFLVSAISIIGQIFLYLLCQSNLPAPVNLNSKGGIFNRYCLGSPPANWEGYHDSSSYIPNNYCLEDLLGHWMLNWQLWWLDLFIALSIIGIFSLLVVGTYLLITDLSQEERRGTLNFIRLSPQSAKSIFLGKALGVPILLYLLVILALPLHLTAGLAAHIPLALILSFYGVLIASCAFFYSAALLLGLISSTLEGIVAFLGSGLIFFFLLFMTVFVMEAPSSLHTPFDWFTLFYPGKILAYLVHATFLPSATVGYLKINNLNVSLWYGQPLWRNPWMGIGFVLFNYGLWTYWIGKGLQRRFHNPMRTLFSKKQSYWITGSFIMVLLGFALQITDERSLFGNFVILQFLLVVFSLIIIIAISPQRQTLQDWARYRHQFRQNPRSLIKDLILGEKSPSTIAIAINLGIIFIYIFPAVLVFPLANYKLSVLGGLVLGINMILVYAVIFQLMLLMRNPKRFLAATAAVISLIILPIVCFTVLGTQLSYLSELWFFSFLPMVAIESTSMTTIFMSVLAQWLAITLIGWQMTRQLQKAGASATKTLLAASPRSIHRGY